MEGKDRWEKKGSSLSLDLFHFSIYLISLTLIVCHCALRPALDLTLPPGTRYTDNTGSCVRLNEQ